MAEPTIILRNARDYAHRLIDKAPYGSVLSIKAPRRTLDQNAKLWAMLTELSVAKPEGRKHTPEVWKAIFCHALGHQQRFEMALDGSGFVPLGFRTSKMSKAEMAELITLVDEYAARHGVTFNE